MKRIPFEKASEQNSVELLFSEKFKDLDCHELSDEMSQIMFGLIMVQSDSELLKTLCDGFLSQVITERFYALGYTMDHKTNIFICILCENRINSIMYCHYLAYWCKKNKVQKIYFNDFCNYIFPFGFPSNKDLNNLWESQKLEGYTGSDNLLDYFRASNSIMNILDI
jgi:hypothetical protein